MDTTQTAVSQTSAAPLPAMPAQAIATAPPVTMTDAQVRAALAQAKETHHLVIDWVRALDVKISPLLSADGALLAACLALLGQEASVLTHRPVTHILLAVTLAPLLYSLLMAISASSPTLKWSRFGDHRHKAVKPKTKLLSVMFFGHIALHETYDSYAQAAKAAFINEAALLDDLLEQTHTNAKIAENKSSHIALSTRGLIAAVGLLIICAVTFGFKL